MMQAQCRAPINLPAPMTLVWPHLLATSGADMNAIVVTALKRPYTFVVLAILILLFGAIAVFKTPTDIFPPIKIPVVAAVWTYNGLSAVRHVGPGRLLSTSGP